MTDHDPGGRIAALRLYPVKGCRAIPLDRAEIGPLGLLHDRRWMLVDAERNRFLSQRVLPSLATLHPRITANSLQLMLPDGTILELPLDDSGRARRVEVWGDQVAAVEPDLAASGAIGRWLGRDVALVRFPETAQRPCDPMHAPPGSRTGFADGFPVLVTSTASLDALNDALRSRGGKPVPMDRFRPNVVIEGVAAGAEDRAKSVELDSGLMLALVKRCERCLVTTVDQSTGARTGKEPLATLAVIRADNATGGVWFGQNAVPQLAADETAMVRTGAVCRLRA